MCGYQRNDGPNLAKYNMDKCDAWTKKIMSRLTKLCCVRSDCDRVAENGSAAQRVHNVTNVIDNNIIKLHIFVSALATRFAQFFS